MEKGLSKVKKQGTKFSALIGDAYALNAFHLFSSFSVFAERTATPKKKHANDANSPKICTGAGNSRANSKIEWLLINSASADII